MAPPSRDTLITRPERGGTATPSTQDVTLVWPHLGSVPLRLWPPLKQEAVGLGLRQHRGHHTCPPQALCRKVTLSEHRTGTWARPCPELPHHSVAWRTPRGDRGVWACW